MTYDKKDLPKIIVLSVILLAMIIYIGVRYAGLSAKFKAEEEARHQVAQVQAQAVPGPTQGVAAATPQLRPSIAAFGTLVPPPARDPFSPIIPPRRQRTTTSRPTPAPTPDTDQQASLPLLPMLPPTGGDASSASRSDVLSVTGIIVGTPSIAVLRQGDDHLIVRPGDSLANDMRVSSITRTTVTISDGRRQYTLRLGG